MKKSQPTRFSTALTLFAALLVGSIGCQSGGGSKWTWNPFSRSGDNEALAENEPQIPVDGATPLIEGAEPAATQVATATATPATPTATEAVAAITPQIETAPTTAPTWTPYPSTDPSANTAPATTPIAKVAAAPATPPSTPLASTGAYDPNGYRPKAAQPPAASADRYASNTGSRYGDSPLPPDFGDLPPLAPPTAPSSGGRYDYTPQAAAPPAAPASNLAGTSGYPVAPPTGTSPFPSTDPMVAAGSPTAPPTAVESLPTLPTTPAPSQTASGYPVAAPVGALPAAPPAGASYPVANATAPSNPNGYTPLGSLPVPPPATDAAEQAASAITQTSGSEGPKPVVRVTTVPGEYRPGGTSTYRSEGSGTRYR